MKLNIFLIGIFFIFSIVTNARILRKKDNVEPRLFDKNIVTRRLALYQTTFARNLIYNTGEELIKEMKKAATLMKEFIQHLKELPITDEQKKEKKKSIIEILAFRILSSEGLLPNSKEEDFITSIENIINKDPSTVEKLMLVGLIGDIGANLIASSTKSMASIDGFDSELSQKVIEEFKKFVFKKYNYKVTTDMLDKIKSKRTSVLWPQKKEQRLIKTNENGNVKVKRTGIFSYGSQSDEILKINKDKIPELLWDIHEIDTHRMQKIDEPFAGHMSGSIGECLLAWDLLIGINPLDIFRKTYYRGQDIGRDARAAIVNAFFIATGYHSAIETIEPTLSYLGNDLKDKMILYDKQDAGHYEELKNGGSTYYLSDLLWDFTKDNTISKKYDLISNIDSKVKNLGN